MGADPATNLSPPRGQWSRILFLGSSAPDAPLLFFFFFVNIYYYSLNENLTLADRADAPISLRRVFSLYNFKKARAVSNSIYGRTSLYRSTWMNISLLWKMRWSMVFFPSPSPLGTRRICCVIAVWKIEFFKTDPLMRWRVRPGERRDEEKKEKTTRRVSPFNPEKNSKQPFSGGGKTKPQNFSS